MADFNVSTVASDIKPPQVTGIADMLGIALGAQKYQQQQKLNPIALEQQQAELDVKKLDLLRGRSANIAQNIQDLLQKSDVTYDDIYQKASEINANQGGDDKSLKQIMASFNPKGTPIQHKAALAQSLAKSLTAQAQLEQLYPKVAQQDIGAQIVSTSQGNPLLAAEEPGVPTGPYMQKSLAPTVATSPTGGPMGFGGGGVPQAGNLNNRPVGVQVVPAGGGAVATGMQQTTQPGQVAPKPGVTAQSMSQPKTPSGPSAVPYVPGEPYDSFRVRAADVAKMPKIASESLNINNVDSIPNQKFTNEKIQKLLDNPNLSIGPIAEAIAKNTGGVGLDANQDEIRKYLEQRIRMEAARTNQDQSSQKAAFGSFGTNRQALKEILYKDNGSLAGQELYQRGILNHAGDINRPNLQSVNKFNTDYATLADPKVTHLIGVIGDKSIKDLSKSDKQHLAKEFPGMSTEQFQKLLDKRQQLLDLVNGK